MNTALWTTSRLLTTAARMNQQRQNLRLKTLNVTHSGATTLRALSDSGPINQTRLAALVHIQTQTMGKVLENLERKGLVSRRCTTHDGRSKRTRITERGNKVLRRIEHLAGPPVEPADQLLRNALISIIARLEAAPA
ncbi:MarR family transcriptional regulator [Pseudarthrobacter sp. B907]|uniref:MarR family winged helix-turn-helix transcriptional regulator n=1 Tax=Pseudarthrobacter sp. B907 TaxID=3158261 RepID=UPI0032DAF80C